MGAADVTLDALAPRMDWERVDESAHLVQFYEDDSFLVDAVAGFVGMGLDAGEAAVVIATKPHRDALEQRLGAGGVDLEAARAVGRYVAVDAAETLSRFMVDGSPDARRFAGIVGSLITGVAAKSRHPRVRAFGEMVALLWAEGEPQAALHLEALWNDLGRQLPFSLLCAYPMANFRRAAQGAPFLQICAAHGHVVPAESYTALASPDERLRTITQLQQKARALEAEVAERELAVLERERLADELKRKVEQLADLDRRKDEFLAMLAHELRNPLSAVHNAVVTARLDPVRRERALDIARRQTNQLGRLVDDLLDVARITQGHIALRTEPVYLAGIIERAVENARSFIEDHGHRVTVSLPPEDIRIDADASRLDQVIVNLLTNAAKYTAPGGRIDVVAERQGGHAVLRVRDTGIGIAPDVLPRIFDLFMQADRALDRTQGGLGIGLTVARRLVELHGGQIEARSEGPGRGAEFLVRLPALPAACDHIAESPRAESAGQRCARVLMVEDNPDGAESLRILLEVLGHNVRVAHDGVAALDAARANPPDVMLIDIGLPGMNGYEVARRVRSDAALKHLVLLALTGYGREEDKQLAMAAGFDYHLVKPVDVGALQDLVSRMRRPESEALQ